MSRFHVRGLLTATALAAAALAGARELARLREVSAFRSAYDRWMIEGQITRVDRAGGRVELSLGSDDGVAVGQELYLIRRPAEGRRPGREGHRPAYLGRVRIESVEPEGSTGRAIPSGRGAPMREGDGVFIPSPTGRIEERRCGWTFRP